MDYAIAWFRDAVEKRRPLKSMMHGPGQRHFQSLQDCGITRSLPSGNYVVFFHDVINA
jgi:hypothetical protein